MATHLHQKRLNAYFWNETPGNFLWTFVKHHMDFLSKTWTLKESLWCKFQMTLFLNGHLIWYPIWFIYDFPWSNHLVAPTLNGSSSHCCRFASCASHTTAWAARSPLAASTVSATSEARSLHSKATRNNVCRRADQRSFGMLTTKRRLSKQLNVQGCLKEQWTKGMPTCLINWSISSPSKVCFEETFAKLGCLGQSSFWELYEIKACVFFSRKHLILQNVMCFLSRKNTFKDGYVWLVPQHLRL